MGSVYPLTNNMIWREDFYSYNTVTQNGGVVVGTPRIDKRCSIVTSNTTSIGYPNTSGLLRNKRAFTICLVVKTPADTNSVTDYFAAFSTNQAGVTVTGYSNVISGFVFPTLDGAAPRIVPVPVTTNTLMSLSFVFVGGTSWTAYQNGIYIDTVVTLVPTTVSNYTSYHRAFNQDVSGYRSIAGAQLRTVQIFNTAFSPTDALEWHRSSLRQF